MDKERYIADAQETKRAFGRLIYLGVPLSIATWLPIAIYAIYLVRHRAPAGTVLLFAILELLVWALSFAVFMFALKKIKNPQCPSCSAQLPIREIDQVLRSGYCPKCNCALFANEA